MTFSKRSPAEATRLESREIARAVTPLVVAAMVPSNARLEELKMRRVLSRQPPPETKRVESGENASAPTWLVCTAKTETGAPDAAAQRCIEPSLAMETTIE